MASVTVPVIAGHLHQRKQSSYMHNKWIMSYTVTVC